MVPLDKFLNPECWRNILLSAMVWPQFAM